MLPCYRNGFFRAGWPTINPENHFASCVFWTINQEWPGVGRETVSRLKISRLLGMSTLAQTNAPRSASVEVCLQPNRR